MLPSIHRGNCTKCTGKADTRSLVLGSDSPRVTSGCPGLIFYLRISSEAASHTRERERERERVERVRGKREQGGRPGVPSADQSVSQSASQPFTWYAIHHHNLMQPRTPPHTDESPCRAGTNHHTHRRHTQTSTHPRIHTHTHAYTSCLPALSLTDTQRGTHSFVRSFH